MESNLLFHTTIFSVLDMPHALAVLLLKPKPLKLHNWYIFNVKKHTERHWSSTTKEINSMMLYHLNLFFSSSSWRPGSWYPIFSTAPTVLNKRLLFISSSSDRCNNWLRTSTWEWIRLSFRCGLELQHPPESNRAFRCSYCFALKLSAGQNLVDLCIFPKPKGTSLKLAS